jgi:hypothetical protein
MPEQKSLGKSGKGVSPLEVRRGWGVDERIEDFLSRLKKVDDKNMPDPALLDGSAGERKKYKEKYSAWVAKLRDLVKTERRFLAAEGTAEGKKRARMRATTYKVRMSLYRRGVVNSLDFVNPMMTAKAAVMLDSGELFSDFFKRRVDSLAREKSYIKLMKKIRDTLEIDADRLSDTEYNAIKELKSLAGHPVLSLLGLTERLARVVKRGQEKAQTARHTTAVRRISINYYLAWMDRVLSNYTKHDWKNLAIALALATGRRPIELFVMGKFSKPEANTLLFSGQAKTKMSDSKPYRIPLLYDPEVVQAALKRMRSDAAIPKDATHDDVNRLTAKPLSDRMAGVFENQAVEFYALRAAYGRLCVQRLYSSAAGTEEHFLASILGHSADDRATVQHYKTIVFDEEMTLNESAKQWEKIVKEEAEKAPEAFITPELISRVSSHADKFKRAQARVFDFILTELKKGNGELTQSYISRVGGFSRDAIKAVLAVVGEVSSPDLRNGGGKRQYPRA